ncbi:MAG: nicotinate phosphoribosyltransferase [Nocardioidaceae bacterium]|nr:nicotinate phosphoribosyltransferase [Nocardioidaceae bacterium]
MPPTSLLTDHYELTMLQGALRSGTARRRVVFELFTRSLLGGRRYGVVAGTGRFLDGLAEFRFGPDELAWLERTGVVDGPTLEWLADYRFRGDVWGYPEGEAFFAGSPVLTVEATFGEAVLLETLALSVLNHDSAIASAASRMTWAAGDRPCIEMGSRRTHEAAAVACARAAYVAGFASTSNLRAGQRWAVPTSGTSAHAFVLLHDSERAAFAAQVDALGASTTLLIDTYDVPAAVRTAVDVAGPDLGAVRIDSGDLAELAAQVRAELDALGARSTRVIVTGDLDEHSIAALRASPVDGYGVGTSLVTGSGQPTSGFVYKLVARVGDDGAELLPVAKNSPRKETIGGRKWGCRRLADDGTALAEVITVDGPAPDSRPLQVQLMRAGERVWDEPLAASRERHDRSRSELPLSARRLSPGRPTIPTESIPAEPMPAEPMPAESMPAESIPVESKEV